MKFADEFRRRSAATTDETRAGFENGRNVAGKFRRRRRINRFAVPDLRQPGVGLDPDRVSARRRFQSRANFHEPRDALAAIRADDIGSGFQQTGRRLFRRGAHHRAVLVLAGIEHHAGDHRQTGGFRRRQGNPGFRQILHRFHDQTVGPAARQSLRLFGERGAQFVFGHVAVHEHFAAGPNRGKNQRAFVRRFARDAGARFVDFLDEIRAPALGQAQAVGAERIRQNNLRTGFDVGPRDGGDFFRTGQVPEVRHFARCESARLELRAPGAVREHRALGDQLLNEWIKCHNQRAFTVCFIKLASVHPNIFCSSSKIRRAVHAPGLLEGPAGT